MTSFSKTTKVLLSSTILAATVSANSFAAMPDLKGLYVGAEGGGAMPIMTKLKINADKKVKLKGGPSYGAKIGYEFYPDFALEFTYNHRASFKMSTDNYNQKVEALGNQKVKLQGDTKIHYDAFGLNMVYNIPMEQSIKPYVFLGAGIAKVQFKSSPATLADDSLAGSGLPKGSKVGELKKTTSTVPFVRLGLGGAVALNDNIDLYGDIKTEITGKVKIKSRLTIPDTKDLDDMKQHFGISEALFGVRFKF